MCIYIYPFIDHRKWAFRATNRNNNGSNGNGNGKGNGKLE